MKRLAAALALCAAFCASGHTFHRSYTEINYNRPASRLEIICQIHADDLEALLSRSSRQAIELDRTRNAEMLTALYVMEQLQMRSARGTPEGLEWIGMEVDRHFATVYLELKLQPGRELPVRLRNTILHAELPDQFNHVQLKRDGRPLPSPVLFFAGDTWKSLTW